EDLFEVVDTIARLLGGSVVVEDVDFRVVAYSAVPGQPEDEGRRSAILNRRSAGRWQRWLDESGIRERLVNSDELIRLDNPWATSLTRYIQPIRAVDQLVGYLWLYFETEPDEDAPRAIREFADLLAPELARRSPALSENPGGHVLRQFLSGGISANRVTSILGVDEQSNVVVIAVDVEATKPDAVIIQNRAVRSLALYTEMHLASSLVGTVDQQVYLLYASPTLPEREVEATMRAISKRLRRAVQTNVRAAAGGVHRGLAAAGISRNEADLTLRVLRTKDDWEHDGLFASMRHDIVLNEIVEVLRAHPILVRGMLDRLITHDRQHNTDYMNTLRIYMSSFGDMRSAAEILHLHPNSLRYRVKRLTEIGGLDLGDPKLRLVLQLLFEMAPEPGDPADQHHEDSPGLG
ncbi:MAG TPA: helix-turn-helix domain-containing protein, partial [Mycobacterium sp.]|nr:helix-turn-helix domain-containing protein [Mycobacterium sp.]